MIPNQGRWPAVILCALLGAWGCDESKQGPQRQPPNPIVGASAGTTGAANAGSTATAGTPGPRAGAGGTSATGASGAGAAGRGGAGAAMDAGASLPGAADAGLDDEGSDAGMADDVGPVEQWSGTTSQGLEISFDVAEAGLTQLRLQYAFPPVCDGDNTTEFDPPAPLGDPFSVSFVLAGATDVTFTGTFASDGRASGRLAFMSTLEPGQPACGIGVLTWNATRQ